MLEKILLATHNPAKLERFRGLLAQLAAQVLNLDGVGIIEKPEEAGGTAEANAELKAHFYFEKSGISVLAEDEALFVDFLPADQQPGVHVRRVDKRKEVSDDELLEYWEHQLMNVPPSQRTGRWHIAYCLALPERPIQSFTIDWPIVFFSPPSKIRVPGWPMDSLQGPYKSNKPKSEMTADEKQRWRAEADAVILQRLQKLLDRSTPT